MIVDSNRRKARAQEEQGLLMNQKQYLALVRHFHSLANQETEKPAEGYYYKLSGSDKTVGLSARGIEQSIPGGDLLAQLFPSSNPVDIVRVSQFFRTENSAERMITRLPYSPEIVVNQRLNKRDYGHFWNMTYRGVEHLHPDQFAIYKALGALKYRPPGGENYFDLFERTATFCRQTLNPFEGNQVIVGHSASLLAIIREIEGLADDEVMRQYNCVSIPNGYIVLYSRNSKNEKWQRESVAETIWTAA